MQVDTKDDEPGGTDLKEARTYHGSLAERRQISSSGCMYRADRKRMPESSFDGHGSKGRWDDAEMTADLDMGVSHSSANSACWELSLHRHYSAQPEFPSKEFIVMPRARLSWRRGEFADEMSRKGYGTGGITTERMAMAMATGVWKYISYSGDLK